MKVKLAEASLRRKELQQQVDRLWWMRLSNRNEINKEGLFEIRAQRKQVTDSVDDIVAKVPKVAMQQVTHCYNWHAKQLRLVDAAIQQANWTTEIDLDSEVMADYIDPYVK